MSEQVWERVSDLESIPAGSRIRLAYENSVLEGRMTVGRTMDTPGLNWEPNISAYVGEGWEVWTVPEPVKPGLYGRTTRPGLLYCVITEERALGTYIGEGRTWFESALTSKEIVRFEDIYYIGPMTREEQ